MVELPGEFDLMTTDAGRDGRWCAINVELLVEFVLIPQAVDERSIFGNLCVMWCYNNTEKAAVEKKERGRVAGRADVDRPISVTSGGKRRRQTSEREQKETQKE